MVELQPPPPTPTSLVLPWLSQPLTPLLWPVLAVSTCIVAASIVRTRRSPDRFPLSPRWLAVAAILSCSFFAALSYGADLTHPAALFAAPAFILVSTLLARSAWHASDQPQTLRTLAPPLAAASMLTTTALLVLRWCMETTPTELHGIGDLGLGIGEATACILPALGVSIIPLALLPRDHPRTAAVRRTVVLFTGFLILSMAATVAACTTATTTPLPYESPLADRYLYLNALAALPSVLAGVCAVGVFFAARRGSSLSRAVIMLFAAAAAFPLLHLIAGAANLQAAFGFDWWRPGVCLAAGITAGVILAPLRRIWPAARLAAALIALAACGLTAGALTSGSASPYASWACTAIALIGLFAASAASAARAEPPHPADRDPLAPLLIAACLLAGAFIDLTCTLQSQLTYQARRHSQAFRYESLPSVTPEITRQLVNQPHSLHMPGVNGDRWAWIVPNSIWWTTDDAWRDALIIADHTQPPVTDPTSSGPYYGARITGANRKLADISFTDTQYVVIVQPAPQGQKSLIVHGITARQATPAQLLAFARIEPANPRVWLGFALGLPLAIRLARPNTSIAAAAGLSAALLMIATIILGLGGGIALLICAGVSITLAALCRDDRWHAATMLGTLMGTALALSGLMLRFSYMI